MKWTGLDDLLARGGKLTKKQVLDHLQQNAIQVNEITREQPKPNNNEPGVKLPSTPLIRLRVAVTTKSCC